MLRYTVFCKKKKPTTNRTRKHFPRDRKKETHLILKFHGDPFTRFILLTLHFRVDSSDLDSPTAVAAVAAASAASAAPRRMDSASLEFLEGSSRTRGGGSGRRTEQQREETLQRIHKGSGLYDSAR